MVIRSRIASFTAMACAALLMTAVGLAQQTEQQQKRDEQARQRTEQTTTLTGCLTKGDTAGRYNFTDQSGQKKDVVASSGVDLDKHAANHTVKLTGTLSDEGRTFHVTKVDHVSSTCETSK